MTLRPFTCLAWLLCVLGTGVRPARGQQPASPRQPATRITAKVDDGVRVALPGTLHPLARAANDRGKVDDAMPVKRVQIS